MPKSIPVTDSAKVELLYLSTELRLHQTVLVQIMESLPLKRDWLDPVVERNARELVRRSKIKTSKNGS